jgi:pre-mRNA-processing factor 6
VALAVAQFFHQNRQIEKAREWYKRAVSYEPDYGDAWAACYQFEVELGLPEQQAEVLKKAILADPHHGEKWIAVSKDISNTKLKTDETLKLVAFKFAGANTIKAQ